MFDPKQFDELAKKLFNALPTSVQNLEKDVQSKFREILMDTFNRLDLVTRDEFDAQSKVLEKTRKKVDDLHKRLDALSDEAPAPNKAAAKKKAAPKKATKKKA